MILALTISLAAARPAPGDVRPPNIVVLVADDLGYGETGMQGNPQIPTPNIDSIAADGIRFTDGYVTASYCSASRAGLLTGRYQARFGYDYNPIGRVDLAAEAGLPEDEITFVRSLADAGYRTGLVGKWHLGAHSNHRGHDAYDHLNPVLQGTEPVEEDAYLTDALTREAVAFVEDNRDQPFCLLLSYSTVHGQLQGAERYMPQFGHLSDAQRQIFAAMLANVDASVGTLLRTLDEHDLQRDTLVFFISDSGGPTRELTSSNAPLRAGKGSLYEGGIRVPFAVRWTGRLPAGQTFEHPVAATDIAATSLAVAGARRPADAPPLDGVDLMPYLTGKERGAPHEELYWRMGDKTALRRGNWKLIRPRPQARFEVYNLGIDIGETLDLADREPKIRTSLIRRWMALDAQMADPLPRPESPAGLPTEVERPF